MRALCFLLLVVFAAPPAGADGVPDEKARAAAIKKGIAHLNAQLGALPEVSGTPRKPFTYAVAGLVYLMERPARATGAKRTPLADIRKYLVGYVGDVARRSRDPKQLPARHGLADSRSIIQYTWPLSVAGLFFAELELRKIATRAELRALETIVAVLTEAQESNGGWGHGRINANGDARDPFGSKLEGMGGYPNTLVSSSNCVAMCLGVLDAMKGYDTAGPVKKAQAYYRAAQLDNGSFPYDPSQRSSGFTKTNVGRSAGSLFAMHCLGLPRDAAFEKGVRYLEANLPWICEGHGSPCLNMMHGALCCRMLGRDTWRKFRETFEQRILDAQKDDGCLECICEQKAFGVTCDTKSPFGGRMAIFERGKRTYTTALHTFVLLLDRDHLQILKKRKPGATTTRSR